MELDAITRQLMLDHIEEIKEELNVLNSLINDKDQERFKLFRQIKASFLDHTREEFRSMIINNEAWI